MHFHQGIGDESEMRTKIYRATSDVDIRIVVDQDVPPMFTTLTGDFAQKYYQIHGVILDTSYMHSRH